MFFPSWLIPCAILVVAFSFFLDTLHIPISPLHEIVHTFDSAIRYQIDTYDANATTFVKKSNHIFDNATLLFQNTVGLEHLVPSPDGTKVFSGTSDGRIVYFVPNDLTENPHEFARTGQDPLTTNILCGTPEHEPICGRPLGVAFAPATLFQDQIQNGGIQQKYFSDESVLLVTDAYKGLLLFNAIGEMIILLDKVPIHEKQVPMALLDNLAVDVTHGIVYMTVASMLFQHNKVFYEALKAEHNGLLIAFSPKQNAVQVLVENLAFPNGIVYEEDSDSLLIGLTLASKIVRYSIPDDTLVDFAYTGGKVDNISVMKVKEKDFLLIGLSGRDDKWMDWIFSSINLRKVMYYLPESILKVFAKANSYSFAILNAETGDMKVLAEDPQMRLPFVTGAHAIGNHLYITSYAGNGILRLPIAPVQALLE